MLGNCIGKGTRKATRKHPGEGEANDQRSHAVLVASLKDVVVSLERCDENEGVKKQCDGVDFGGMRLSPLIIMNRKERDLPQSTGATVPPCYAVVLWSSAILEELKLHVKFENKLHTRLSFGKLLSEAVIDENPYMNWNEPFNLVDVISDQEVGITGDDLDDSIRIHVMETSTADNWRIPASRRMWELYVSQCCVKLGLEMLRKNPTTVMIWGARKTLYPDESLIKGRIHLDTFCGPLNVMIFHGEEITEERRRAIQGNFSASELELFRDDFRRRIDNNLITQKFAVHFSKLSSKLSRVEIRMRIKRQLAQLLGASNETGVDEDSEVMVVNEMLQEHRISSTVAENEAVLPEVLAADALVAELGFLNLQVIAKVRAETEKNEGEPEQRPSSSKSKPSEEPRPIEEKSGNENDNDSSMDVEDVESVMKFAATQELRVDDESDVEEGSPDNIDVACSIGESIGNSDLSDYRFTQMLEDLARE